jgi:hypothetical protein
MNWSKIEVLGDIPVQGMRSHASALAGNKIFVFGGKNNNNTFNQLYIFDMGTFIFE